MNMKDLAATLTQKAVDARLAQEKASMEDQPEVSAMYDGQVRAYMDAAEQTGATDAVAVFDAIEVALYGPSA